jgi:epoxyqueuosine reductase QueG
MIIQETHMAEFTKGLENLQEAIDNCQQACTQLATTSADEASQAKTSLQEILAALNEVSDKFFIKTMMSVPPTKMCKTDAATVVALIDEENWNGLPSAVEKLQKATKALVTKAKMDGTIIT